jgi:hypothetical protein
MQRMSMLYYLMIITYHVLISLQYKVVWPCLNCLGTPFTSLGVPGITTSYIVFTVELHKYDLFYSFQFTKIYGGKSYMRGARMYNQFALVIYQ